MKAEPNDRAPAPEPAPDAAPDAGADVLGIEIDCLLEAVFRRWGYDFRDYSRAHVRRRLLHRMELSGMDSVPAMMHRALTDREFFGSLLAVLSINITEMFRDPPFYRALREEIVPRLRTWPFVKIWHAGCSTGEEVYSMAIVLREAGLEGRARIYATDFNPEALRRAKEGIYPLEAIRNYTRNYQAAGGEASFADYYTARYESALIDRTLREHVVFSEHNLVTDGVFGEMHLIFCRNVLIYFNPQLQARALDLFHDSLCPGGILCLGTKESLQFSGHLQAFEQLQPGQKIFRRKLLPGATQDDEP
jgi:chemotaxis protein methyltransferase CheR